MFRLWVFIIWVCVGFCVLLAGCSAGLTAESLEATTHIDNPWQAQPPTVEVHYDEDRVGPGPDPSD